MDKLPTPPKGATHFLEIWGVPNEEVKTFPCVFHVSELSKHLEYTKGSLVTKFIWWITPKNQKV